MSSLTVIMQAVAFEDAGANSNPTKKPVDWARTVSNVPVENAGTQRYKIQPLGTLTVIDGTRPTSIDGTSEFSLAVNAADPNRYRITNTAGTLPGFRTDRGVDCTGIELTAVVNPNLSVTITAGSGTPFTAVEVSDIVFIPGPATGDPANVFNALNVGYWTAISRSDTSVTLVRLAGEIFTGLSDVVTPTDASQLQAFSSDGVQVGDTVEISAGFATTAQHAYEVLAVNPLWIEFASTSPLGDEVDIIPGSTGLVFYTSSKRWLRIETDQELIVRLNNDSGNTNRIEPVIPGDENFSGWMEKFGAVWKLVLINRSTRVLNLTVMSAE